MLPGTELLSQLTAAVRYTDMSGLKHTKKSNNLATFPKSFRSCAHQVMTQLSGKNGRVSDLFVAKNKKQKKGDFV